jgi:two-component system, NtrC family, sensor kinase
MVFDDRERARRAALQELEPYEFVQTAYDDLVRAAASICEAPMALICFIDGDRLRFKASVGIAGSDIPREQAFSTSELFAGADLLVVEDASVDPRFAAHPRVIGKPHIRFYIGVPLTTSAGHVVGTVCAMDTQPRSISARAAEEVGFLARQIMRSLEERKRTSA